MTPAPPLPHRRAGKAYVSDTGLSNGTCPRVYKHRQRRMFQKEKGEHQNKTEGTSVLKSDTHPDFPFSPMGGWFTFDCNYFILPGRSAGQHNPLQPLVSRSQPAWCCNGNNGKLAPCSPARPHGRLCSASLGDCRRTGLCNRTRDSRTSQWGTCLGSFCARESPLNQINSAGHSE